jgi:hypothetical protein
MMLTWLVLTFVVTGLVFIVLSIPMIQRKVKPNRWYGFRVPKTLNNPDIWYEANAYMGRWLFAMGAITVVLAVGAALVPSIDLDTYAIVTTVGITIFSVVMVVAGFLYLRKL